MADDHTKRGPADRVRVNVNVNEDYERRYWCAEFGCVEVQSARGRQGSGRRHGGRRASLPAAAQVAQSTRAGSRGVVE